MRLGIGQFNSANPEYLLFAQQLGIKDVLLNTARLPSVNGTWTLRDLVKLRLSIEQHGLKLSPWRMSQQIFMTTLCWAGRNGTDR